MKGNKRVEGNGIAVLIDLDDCMGCFGCEVACRETHRYPYEEEWTKTIRREPFLVDGKLRLYHIVAPLLDKCDACFRDDPNPLCMTGCTTKAFNIGTFEDMVKEADGRHCVIYTA